MKSVGKAAWLAGMVLGLNMATAEAALFDRGAGLIYDDVLNVTWLQDANYAKTSGYDADGLMDWVSAKTWAGNLVYHDSVRNVDYSDWRLAKNTPVNGSNANWNYSFSVGGYTDVGFNITSVNSELAYMYYENLGLAGYYSPSGITQTNFFGKNGVVQTDVGLVKNLTAYSYWSAAEFALYPGNGWYFSTYQGNQNGSSNPGAQFLAWAVRDGDVAAVPVPGAIWLFGSGLFGLLGLKRRVKMS